jgi:HlyD family secretion protein
MRRVLWVVVALVVVGGAVFIFQNNQSQQTEASLQSDLQTAAVTRADIMVAVRATGRVEPVQRSQLSFDSAGIVQEVLVEEGQFVQAGQVLARLDDEVQRISVEQAEWALRIAELSLESLLTPPSDSELAAAQAAVNSAWVAFTDLRDNAVDPETVRIAELQYEQALAAYDAAEQASQDALRSDMTEAQRGAASFAAEIARLQMEQVRRGVPESSINAAQAQVAQAQAQRRLLEAGPAQAQVERAAIAVEQARLQLERVQARFEDTVLRAPFDGIVNRVNIQEGGLAGPAGLPAVDLVDVSHLSVTVDVDEIDIASVALDQPVELTLDALPDETFTGAVGQIADVAQQSSGVVEYEVRIDLDPAEAAIRPGMTTAATIVVEEVDDVLVVPNLYLRLDRQLDQTFVKVLQADGTLVEREVELGIQDEMVSEVLSGLEEGDIVAFDLTSSGFSFFGDE